MPGCYLGLGANNLIRCLVLVTAKDLNRPDRIGTLLIKNMEMIICTKPSQTFVLKCNFHKLDFPGTWKCDNRIYLKKPDKDRQNT